MGDEGHEAAIRARAHQIWEQSGGTHGDHEDHWRQAEAELGGAAVGAPEGKPSAPPAPAADEPHRDGLSPHPGG